jgi:predicted ester cyclase
MSDQENIRVAQSVFEAWNMGDLSKTIPMEADNFLAESPGTPVPLDATQNRAYLQNFMNAFPGSKFEILNTIAQGDYVVINWKTSGTNMGPLQAPSGATIPPTGKMSTLMGSTTALVQGGKVVHVWNFWDMASLLGQLGLMPPM